MKTNPVIRLKIVRRLVRVVALAVLAVAFCPGTSPALKNPAAVYCEALGYEYLVFYEKAGARGACRLPTNPVDAWDFLLGVTGQAYGYCATQGYGSRTVTDPVVCASIYNDTCSVCVLGDGSETEVTALMGLDFAETSCGDGTCSLPENYSTCPADCPSGIWDAYCDAVADSIIDPDCPPGVDPDAASADSDGDGVIDAVDNCPGVPNRDQLDHDGDGAGDACDGDMDGDWIPNDWEIDHGLDPLVSNFGVDSDGDGVGDQAEYLAGTDPLSDVSFPGATTLSLEPGLNVISLPALPGGKRYTAHALLAAVGDENVVSSISRFDRVSGVWETAAYVGDGSGTIAGPNFNIAPNEGYVLYMKTGVVVLP